MKKNIDLCPKCGSVMPKDTKCPHCEGFGLREPECSCDCYITPNGVDTGLVKKANQNCPIHGGVSSPSHENDHLEDCGCPQCGKDHAASIADAAE